MDDLKMNGKITEILEVQKGTSKEGKEWKKLSFVIDNGEKYNNIICFDLFGDEKVDNFQKYNKLGQDVEVSFNVKSNKWKDKYFTSLDAWKVFSAKTENVQQAEPVGNEVEPDDLPF